MRNDVIKEQTIPMNPDKNIHNKFDRDVSSLDRDMRSGITFCERCPEWWRWSMKLPSPVAFSRCSGRRKRCTLQHCLRIWGKRAARAYSAHEVTCNFVGSVPFLQRHCQTLSNDFMVMYLNLLEIQVHSYLKVLPSNIKKIMRAIVPFNASYQIHTCGWKI